MGLLSAFGDVLSSACSFASSCVSRCVSAVGGVLSSAVSGIASAVNVLGPSVSGFVQKMLPVIGSVLSCLPQTHPLTRTLSLVVNVLGAAYAIMEKDERPEDFGQRVLQAAEAGHTLDKYEGDFDAYMRALREFPVDPKKAAESDFATNYAACMAVVTVGMEKIKGLKPGELNQTWLLPLSNPDYFTPERMKTIVADGNFKTQDFGAFLDKKLTDETKVDTLRKDLATAVAGGGVLTPEQRRELNKALAEARENWAKLDEEIKGASTDQGREHSATSA